MTINMGNVVIKSIIYTTYKTTIVIDSLKNDFFYVISDLFYSIHYSNQTVRQINIYSIYIAIFFN